MARPTIESINRSPGFTSSRTQAAPGLSVAAPLDVSVGPNNLQAIAEILGVGASAAMGKAQQANQERVQEETEMIAAEAEAEFYGDKIDQEQYKRQKTYAKRVDVLTGAREGTEKALALRNSVEDFIKENPLADEQKLRDHIQQWKQRELVDDEGNPLPFMSNPRVASVVESALNETSYGIIAGHRKGYEERVKAKGGAEAQGLILANAKQRGTLTTGDYEAYRSQLKSFGYSDEQINTAVAQVAIAAGRELGDPKVIEALPEVWSDGSPTAALDADLMSTLTAQKSMLTSKQEADRIKALEPERFKFQSDMDDKIMKGEPFTEEDYKRGVVLGYSGDALANIRGQSLRAAQSLADQAAAEAEKAQADEVELNEIRASPFSVTDSKAEEVYGGAYDRAVAAGDMQAAGAVIKESIGRGVLPRTYRNVLNRVPPDAAGFKTWHASMKTLDDLDDQVFASIGPDSRMAYNTYNGLMALGRFTPEQAFQRMQARNPERGRTFVKSKAGIKAINDIAGNNGSSMAKLKAAELLVGFGSLDDFSDEEAAHNAKKSFEKSYFIKDGIVFNRAQVRDENDLEYIKQRIATDRTKAGKFTDPDDLIVAPANGTDEVFVRVRNEPTDFVTIRTSDIRKAKAVDAQQYRTRVDKESGMTDARASVESNLNPWRKIKGESGLSRQTRASRENEERRRRGLPTYPTPISWDNANPARSK